MDSEDRANFGTSAMNQQLNYKRTFLSPEKVRVDIPTFPFQAFDLYSSGFKIKPADLLNLIISARLFATRPALNGDRPDDSLIDTHHLLQDHRFYIAGLRIDIFKQFHDRTCPKFPVVVEVDITNVGKSSSRQSYCIRHPAESQAYVMCEIDDVLVDKVNKKPKAFPDWWKSKYSYIDTAPKTKLSKPVRPSDVNVVKNVHKVEFEHLDHNLHTTSSAYLRFCFNALFFNLKRSLYSNISLSMFSAGVKSIAMLFFEESLDEDILTNESWEDSVNRNLIHFDLMKENKNHCCSVSIEFYEANDANFSKL